MTSNATPQLAASSTAIGAMLHPMIDPKIVRVMTPLVIERGKGCYVWDVDGNRYLDTVASLWNVNVGHNRAEIKQAIVEQLDRIAYYSTFGNTSNPPAEELAGRLVSMFRQEKVSQVFFSSGGSDAVESALKLSRQYWKLEGKPERTKFISLNWGYHGVHLGGASVNGNPLFREAYEPLLPGCIQIEAPYTYRNRWNERNAEKLAELCAKELDEAIVAAGPETVAAFIAEPVQGAGGVIVPDPTFWPLVRKVLDKHGVLLISDEIVTGFGRLGSMCGARVWDVAPDIMAMAKGINSGYVPLGATLLNERVASAWDRPGVPAALMHGYTYSGHPLACAAANANLDIVVKDDLPANARAVGAYLQEKLKEFVEYSHVGEVRGMGLMGAVELVADKSSREMLLPSSSYVQALIGAARGNGAIVRVQGNRLILSPPLVITREQVDEAIFILHIAFRHAEG